MPGIASAPALTLFKKSRRLRKTGGEEPGEIDPFDDVDEVALADCDDDGSDDDGHSESGATSAVADGDSADRCTLADREDDSSTRS